LAERCCFQSQFLLGEQGSIACFIERTEHALFSVPQSRPFYEQIVGGARQIGSGIFDIAVGATAKHTRKGFLHQIGRILTSDIPSEIMEQPALLGTIEGREVGSRARREPTMLAFGGVEIATGTATDMRPG
jgi:hypothetical protein